MCEFMAGGHGLSEISETGSSPNKKPRGCFDLFTRKKLLGGGKDPYKVLMFVYSFKNVGRSIPLQSYIHQPSGKNLVSNCVPLNILSMMDAGKHHFTQRQDRKWVSSQLVGDIGSQFGPKRNLAKLGEIDGTQLALAKTAKHRQMITSHHASPEMEFGAILLSFKGFLGIFRLVPPPLPDGMVVLLYRGTP